MFRDFFILEKILGIGRKLIPRPVFSFFQPWYHGILALSGVVVFGFPSHKIKVIGVTGTKGKSTTVYLITKFLEEALPTSQGGPAPVAAIGSLGYKIGDKEWPNNLKMTMPGRWKIQKFLAQAVRAGCQFIVLEVTSEGIKQKRHLGIKFDAAIFTNLEKEHIESHGSFEKYYESKQKLFKRTKNIHILNADSPYFNLFSKFPAKKKLFYSLPKNLSGTAVSETLGLVQDSQTGSSLFIRMNPRSSFASLQRISPQYGSAHEVPQRPYPAGFSINTHLIGDFNYYNILAAAAATNVYGVSYEMIQKALDKIKNIPGRLEFIETGQDFKVVVDYAHTPGSLEAVYKTLKESLKFKNSKLICVLGAAGGGRDKWKRAIFGEIAEKYCDSIILTDEDPYDEPPEKIIEDVASGIKDKNKLDIIIDRRKAIKKAMTLAQENDIVVITGKGSENSIAVARGKKIPWSDKNVILEELGF